MVIYVLHFLGKHYHAGHYLGVTENLPDRLAAHAQGRGAKLTAHLSLIDHHWTLARVLRVKSGVSARRVERLIKNANHGPRYCPLCAGPNLKTPHNTTPIALDLLAFPYDSVSLRKDTK